MNGEVVWSVIYMMAILMIAVGWVVYYIMRMAYLETREGESTVTYPIIGTFDTSPSKAESIEVDRSDKAVEVREVAHAH